MLSEQEYREYMDNVVLKCCANIAKREVYADIINRDHQIEFLTNLSARSVGIANRELWQGISFNSYQDENLLKQAFSEFYNEDTREMILFYGKKMLELQKTVFEKCQVISFIDMLPYNNQFVCYLTSYFPLVHSSGEVVAILSSSIRSHLLHFQEHIDELAIEPFADELSPRQQEIMFLLANDVSQEQIAQLLNVTRGTISSIITHQLCPKFAILGTNARALSQIARRYGFHRQIPTSLWRPALIVLNEGYSEE